MKKIKLQNMALTELGPDESSMIEGGKSIFYYLAYDVGFFVITAAQVAGKIADSIIMGTVTK
jgi:hypothetical protein